MIATKQRVRLALDRLPDPIAYWCYTIYDAARGVLVGGARWPEAVEVYCRELLRAPRIVAGPFSGACYTYRSVGSPWLPKVLGTYECELNNAIEEICRSESDLVIDIGCAEGYYAVGLARRLPRVRVIGYDIEARARHALRRLAAANRVSERVTIRGLCTHDELRHVLGSRTHPVLISDCEGAEDTLLRPDQVPELTRTTMLVEAHDFIIPGVSGRIQERFAPTHRVEVIDSRIPARHDLPPAFRDAPEEVVGLLKERAMPMQWLFMQPLGCRPEAR